MFKYLTGILAPVGLTGTKHVLRDHVVIIVAVSAHVVSKRVHLSLSEVLRLIPQTWKEERNPALVNAVLAFVSCLVRPNLVSCPVSHVSFFAFGLVLFFV